uniref:Uncharacterized protein n=1 Tax=Anthurium amnicola TaxID=1678845 RepID=A0A1D1ZFJ2_9ARAE
MARSSSSWRGCPCPGFRRLGRLRRGRPERGRLAPAGRRSSAPRRRSKGSLRTMAPPIQRAAAPPSPPGSPRPQRCRRCSCRPLPPLLGPGSAWPRGPLFPRRGMTRGPGSARICTAALPGSARPGGDGRGRRSHAPPRRWRSRWRRGPWGRRPRNPGCHETWSPPVPPSPPRFLSDPNPTFNPDSGRIRICTIGSGFGSDKIRSGSDTLYQQTGGDCHIKLADITAVCFHFDGFDEMIEGKPSKSGQRRRPGAGALASRRCHRVGNAARSPRRWRERATAWRGTRRRRRRGRRSYVIGSASLPSPSRRPKGRSKGWRSRSPLSHASPTSHSSSQSSWQETWSNLLSMLAVNQ